MIQELFIPYTEALELKKLGFDEPCLAFYDILYNGVTQEHYGKLQLGINPGHLQSERKMLYIFGQQKLLAPTYGQSFRWFREKHNLDYTIITNYDKIDSKMIKSYRVGIIVTKNNMINLFFLRPKDDKFKFIEFERYQEAELECLKKLIKICQE